MTLREKHKVPNLRITNGRCQSPGESKFEMSVQGRRTVRKRNRDATSKLPMGSGLISAEKSDTRERQNPTTII